MRKVLLLVLFSMIWTTGFSQNLSFKFGTPFKRASLDVRWNGATNTLPAQASIYHLLPRRFSPIVIAYVMAPGSFTEKDLVHSNANEMLFKKPDNLTTLWISFRLGAIEYASAIPYGPTNLARDVPEMNQLPQLTTNFLETIGISMADLEKRPDGSPNIGFSEPFTEYFVNHTFITNIAYRAVNFGRAVDGARFIGNGAGGNCEVQFGEHGKVSRIWLSWRNLEREKAYPVATPATLIKWIRAGKAVQNMIPMNVGSIDWKTVRSVTVHEAKLCYYAGDPFTPTDWLMPFAALWTTVDTDNGKIDVEIDCPVIDQSQAAQGKSK
jgi:hypothetical protein